MSKEIAEGLNNIADALWGIADAITPRNAHHAPGRDAAGGSVGSLTEAMMGITAAIANHDVYANGETLDRACLELESIAVAVTKLVDKE